MKTAKPRHTELIAGSGAAISSRRQPARQARSNPPRSSLLAASVAGQDAHGHDQPIDIFPAITHFTDAITSLPKDLVRHFTLLKEVDAKIFQPEEKLFQLVGDALKSQPPESHPANDGSSSTAPASAPMSAQNSINGSLPTAPSNDPNYNAALYGDENLPRRQLFRETAFKIQEMLVSLEEKNHVISTANEALSKQLARIDNVWPHLESEFSDEAKWGSNTHWAYPENRISRANATERSRRDGASAITAAAQQLAEEAAARTEARKQAVAAKKKQHQDSDADAEHEKKVETAKKSGNSKSRKAVEAAIPVGLGITTESNGDPPPKKRKVDSNKDKATTNGGQPMERALSSVFGNNTNSTSKAKTSSPRATPAPEAGASKKRKALPTVNGGGGQPKKTKNGLPSALSPPVTSSPILPNFDPRMIGRGSPVPAAVAARPVTSRARNNSTASNLVQRPSSSASNRPNGAIVPVPDGAAAPNGRAVADTKPVKETPIPVKVENVPKEDVPPPSVTTTIAQAASRKNSVVKEDTEAKGEPASTTPQTVTTVVTTKSGRASKPSTPALGNFPEAARSRSSRNTQAGGAKRSHKKGASVQAALAAQTVDEDANSSVQGDDEGDIDANEPRYCYCNGVSYGEMVACDADDCEKEWFHLGCVGLRSAPSSSTKWYCDNCKNRMKNGGKKLNGR
ncbi:phd finger domain-containing protein [Seiridium cupressi]